MEKLEIAAFYIGLNLFILLGLAVMTVRARARGRVLFGDGGDAVLARAIRAHGNAVENIPIGAVGLLALALLPQTPALALHAAGAVLTLGRAAHGIGLSRSEGRSPGRAIGMLLTWLALLGMGAGLVIFSVS